MTLKLVMPMAGMGSRFVQQGYSQPKPVIDVAGKPMFVRSVESIGIDFDDYVFIIQAEHNISKAILEYYPQAKIIELEQVTQGAACTVLKAQQFFEDTDSLFVCNCDNFMQWDKSKFVEQQHHDGIIMVFEETEQDPKWSYAQVEDGLVVKVAEKNPISKWATSGHYYWRSWATFVESANRMIEAEDTVNGEYYLCPVYNHTPGNVVTVQINNMQGVGTPEELQAWLKSH
jgi:NDP-sugar pyrophosphorylase family protein